VPRKRSTRLPSAVFKALVPKPLRKRRARRAAPASVGPLKAARASARSASKIAKTASSASRTVKPSTRKATARAASSRTTKPRTTTVRKPTRSSARGKAASRAGKGTWRRARFTGVAGSRSYRVYVPLGLRRTTKVPLLLALHGCTQNGLDFAAGTRFNDLADKHKFVVVYPEQSRRHNGLRCWNWFRSAHQFRAQGEPAILAGIVRRVSQEAALWRIDAERVYVAGISAGGGMALVLAATYPELFAAVGVHSAPPYRSASGPANALAAMQGAALKGASAQVPADVIEMGGCRR
jgi:poly(hydroxyalkanoate) depolymerase family esterase